MTAEEIIKKEKEQLFEREFFPHADALYNFAFHLTYNEDDANDLVQDTFLKSYRFINSYEKGTNAKAWLFKILKNSFINEYRKDAAGHKEPRGRQHETPQPVAGPAPVFHPVDAQPEE